MFHELTADAVPAVLHQQLGSLVRRFSHSDEAETVLHPSDDCSLQVITASVPRMRPRLARSR